MASRNMHLFLEMKNKFPDLPEDILRNYIPYYAEDPEKCIQLLLQERANFHPLLPFSDFRLHKTNPRKNETKILKPPELVLSSSEGPSKNISLPESFEEISYQMPTSVNGRSTSHAGVVHLPGHSTEMLIMPPKAVARSAPVMLNERPFFNIYKYNPLSSHHDLYNLNSQKSKIFYTSKEHKILNSSEPSTDVSLSLENPNHSENAKDREIKLSNMPSFPLHYLSSKTFNKENDANVTVSQQGYTTSLNFEIQSQASNRNPVEISNLPSLSESNCQNFDSHIEISFASPDTRFSALRLHNPDFSQPIYSFAQIPSFEQTSYRNYSKLSSQAQDFSKFDDVYKYDLSAKDLSPGLKRISQESNYTKQANPEKNVLYYYAPDAKTQVNYIPKFQDSQAYIQAVINHQIVRMDLLSQELQKTFNDCSQLKKEVSRMELELLQSKFKKNSFPYLEDLQKLREENRKLRIECNCLSMEVDLYSTGKIPLGITDEDFYSNIFTGPNGVISTSSETNSPFNEKEQTSQDKSALLDDNDDDEKNRWKCKKCTFANHPALEKCEMCELPKNSGYIECNSKYFPSWHLRLIPPPDKQVDIQTRQSISSVRISVTQKVPSSSKSIKFEVKQKIMK